MTLMDAQQYDEARARRRRNIIIAGVFVVLILAWVVYHFRNYPERRAADKFFSALQSQNIEGAYALWLKDPDWKQHPQKYTQYSYADFSRDWGPAGDWGIIKSHEINCSYSSGSGVIVQATVNNALSMPTFGWTRETRRYTSHQMILSAGTGGAGWR